jgi:ORF6N domain
VYRLGESLRGQRVILDRELAAIYGSTTKRVNEQIKRNRDCFPEDFMFQLTAILSAIRELMNPPPPKRRPIGFTADLTEKS